MEAHRYPRKRQERNRLAFPPPFCYIHNMRLLLLTIAMVSLALAESPAKADSAVFAVAAVPDTVVDTVYVIMDDGIPWNREHFDPERLLRREPIDPALSVAYTYSLSFFSSPWLHSARRGTRIQAHRKHFAAPDVHQRKRRFQGLRALARPPPSLRPPKIFYI